VNLFRKHSVLCLLALLFVFPTFSAKAQSSNGTCYDANDASDLRLWDDQAPGAVGNNPCTDIPFLRVFRPEGSAAATDIGIVVMPGGGYNELTDENEQTPVGQYFANKLGITTFVLYYRLVQANGTYRYPVPMWDGQRAVRYARFNAARFGINPAHIGVFGFSAGGHLASTIAIHFATNFNLPYQDGIDQTDARPGFLGLGYPVISMDPNQFASSSSLSHLLYGYTGAELSQLEDYLSGQKQVNSTTPPTYIFESFDDKVVDSQNSILFYEALRTAKVPSEAHIFQKGTHGAGLATTEPYEYVWPELFHNWLSEQGLLPSPWKLVPDSIHARIGVDRVLAGRRPQSRRTEPNTQANLSGGYLSGGLAPCRVRAAHSQARREGMGGFSRECSPRKNGRLEAQDQRIQLAHAESDIAGSAILM
jgi:acetyl esterase/lipase